MDEAKGTILIVDDEESIRSILSRKLQAEGYNCEIAADGEEAMGKASTQDFDLVLLDIRMPRMSGMEVLSRMTSDHPDTSVVMITVVVDTQTAVEAMKLGAYDYVTKPFNLDHLKMTVEKALERRRLVLENRDKMAKRAKKKKEKKERAVEEEAAKVARLSRKKKVVRKEEPLEELEEARDAAAEIPQKETAREEWLSFKQAILQQCMKDPSFRARVIYHLAKKLR